MPPIYRLKALEVKNASKPGRLADGGGLYLQISKWGTKSWVFRYTRSGRSRHMGLGPLRDRSLAQAREEAAHWRGVLRDSHDPVDERKKDRATKLKTVERQKPFSDCAQAYIDGQQSGWKNAKHRSQWENTLKTYAYPVLGKRMVSEIDTGLVLRVLEPIWSTKTESASRLRGRIENILDWARVRGYREGENPARWRGHLDKILPKPSKTAHSTHYRALPYSELSPFMDALRQRDETPARALEFLILTAARTSEVTHATWDEADLEQGIWKIPKARMKSGRAHRVPLSDRARALLGDMNERQQGPFIFPSTRKAGSLSNMAMLQLLGRMNYGHVTVHGFRSTFRDWIAEQTAYPREIAEHALAHVISNKTEAAYQRGDLFLKRQKLMEDWATFCAAPPVKSANITPIRA